MEYTLGICVEMMGDVIPLYLVAETMAVHAASGYGNSSVHGPTLESMRPLRIATLVDAAREGRLIVCSQHGQVGNVEHLVESAALPAGWGAGDPKARDIMALYAKAHHLIAWGENNGDIFHFVNEDVVVTDLLDHDGNVIEKGYYRTYVKGDSHSSPAYQPPSGLALVGSAPPMPYAAEVKVAGARWSPECLAELAQYRKQHGTKASAKKFGITTTRIRQLLPIESATSSTPTARNVSMTLLHRLS